MDDTPLSPICDAIFEDAAIDSDSLFLARDFYGDYLLKRDGQILHKNALGETPIEGPTFFSIVRLGAAAYGPKILELLPEKPESISSCSDCQGSGFTHVQDAEHLCASCMGLGWVKPEPEPVVPEPEQFSPHENVLFVRRWEALIVVCIVMGVLCIPSTIISLANTVKDALMVMVPIASVVLGIVLTWAYLWPKWIFKYHGCTVFHNGLQVTMGAWRKQTVFLPLSRIQHADMVQGMIERKYDLAHLVVHTAGAVQSDIKIKGLSPEVAMRLSRQLTFANDQVSHD